MVSPNAESQKIDTEGVQHSQDFKGLYRKALYFINLEIKFNFSGKF